MICYNHSSLSKGYVMAQAAKYVGMSDKTFREICSSFLNRVAQKCYSCKKPLRKTITGRVEVRVNDAIVCKCVDCYYEDKAVYLSDERMASLFQS